MKNKILLHYLFLFISLLIYAQNTATPNPELQTKRWQARWITYPGISGKETGVYLFKKLITLDSIPGQFIINISADNRYKLYVNGRFINDGPARGDAFKWRFETLDIAPFLKQGVNAIAVKVWYFDRNIAPEAQISVETGLIVQGNSAQEYIVDSGPGWKVMKDTAYSFYRIDHLNVYYVVGPGERFDARLHPFDWLKADFKDSAWVDVKKLQQGMALGSIREYGTLPLRALYPREIPLMENKEQEFARIRRISGIDNAEALLNNNDVLVIPAKSKVTVLLDNSVLTTAYPRLHLSKGKDSEIKLTYAESLFLAQGQGADKKISRFKGNRNEVNGKIIQGNYDIVISDGGVERIFEPLWWRTFRYVQLEIATHDEPLLLHHFNSIFRAYPIQMKAKFSSDNASLSRIFETAWHTQRLCAGETYFDCPYYEQIQYTGDTRIQGLNTFFAAGDTLLWKKSISDFYNSRLPFGLVRSRYPDSDPQIIPGYALIWILMLHDYMMFGNDSGFIKAMLPAAEDILLWYEARLNPNNLPGLLEGWNFTDWVTYPGWHAGVPPMGENNSSSVNALSYIYSIQKAVDIFRNFGRADLVKHWTMVAKKINKAVIALCWDEQKKMFADTPAKNSFSQHANILAVLVNAIPKDQQKDLMQRIYADTTIAGASYYFRFYLAEALQQAGLSNLYFDMLTSWQEMLDRGLTTFVERPEPSRSDCHAWSASPLYQYYSIICGIHSTAAGFKKISIAPHPGSLQVLDAGFPHPLGDVILKLKKQKDGGIEGQVILPDGLDGDFQWKGKHISLTSGITQISL